MEAGPKFEDTMPIDEAPPRFEDTLPIEPDEMSSLKAGALGAAKGATLGWADEIGGALQTGGKAITGEVDFDKLVDEYQKNRDNLRKDFAKAAATHPKVFGASQIAGGVAPMLAAGPAALGVKGLLSAGGILGAGESEADLTEGEVAPVAGSALMGAGTNLVLGKALEKGVPYVASKVAPYVEPVVDKAKQGLGWAGKKLGSALSGIPEGDIATYASQTPQVNQLIKASGGDVTEASDIVRGKLQGGLRGYKSGLYKEIDSALSVAPKERSISIEPIIKQLEEAKGGLNPNLESGAISQIDELISKARQQGMDPVRGEVGHVSKDGFVDLAGLNDLKNFFQDRGRSAYLKDGQIFSASPNAARAATFAGAAARKELNALAPEIAQANNKLAMLHNLEEKMNKNLIAPGKTESALLAAGSGANPRNAKMLQRMGEITGQDALGKAKQLSAARTFANPPLLPMDLTGKAVARQGLGAVIGGAIGGVPGAMVGGAITSPAVLKGGINAANTLSDAVKRNVQAFGKWAPVLNNAQTRGATSLGAADYILQQTDPNYKKHRDTVLGVELPEDDQSSGLKKKSFDSIRKFRGEIFDPMVAKGLENMSPEQPTMEDFKLVRELTPGQDMTPEQTAAQERITRAMVSGLAGNVSSVKAPKFKSLVKEGEIRVSGGKNINAIGREAGSDYGYFLENEDHNLPFNNVSILEHIEVDPSKQGTGIGSKLLTEYEKKAKELGHDAVLLNASPMGAGLSFRDESKIEDLVRFYKKHGYETYQDQGTNQVMYKPLLPDENADRLARAKKMGFE